MTQFNAITKYAGTAAKHRNISNPVSFIRYMVENYTAHTIFFYDSVTKSYVGYWKRGLPYQIH